MKNLLFVFFSFFIVKIIRAQIGLKNSKILEKFFEEWSQNMPDFVGQYMYTIPVKKRTQVEYYENITKVPCKFQGAFILDEAQSDQEKIEFKIISPNNIIIYQKTDVASIFSVEINEKGLYTLVFNNKFLNRDVRPSLVVNSGQNLVLERENLSETENKLEKIMAFLLKYDQDRKLTRGFIRRGNEELKKTNKFFYVFSCIESIVLIAVSIWQYFYLKHLFEIKGSL